MVDTPRPWLKSYLLGPYKLAHSLAPYPDKPLYDILDQSAADYPNQTAILFQGKEIKYRQLKKRVDCLAQAFVSLGLKQGERVSLYLPNCPEFIISYWAVLKAGGVIVPISILRVGDGLVHEIQSSGSRFVICQESHLSRLLDIRSQIQVERILLVADGEQPIKQTAATQAKDLLDLAELIEAHEPLSQPVPIDPQHNLCELAFTGGATGVPKGVMLSHANRYASILQCLPWFMKSLLGGIKGKASVMLPIPLFHSYGNFVQQSAIYLGMRLILLPDPRDTQAMLASILEYRPFLVAGVPTQFMRLADAGLKRSNSMLFSGSAPLPQEIVQEIKQKTGMPVSEAYGLTETATVSHVNLSAFSRITGFMLKEKHGIGVPVPDLDCRLVDPQTDKDAPEGSSGELWLRGPQIMLGYWPEAGSGLDADGWLHTGDIAIMDEDGYFQIIDRIKDMVNVSGMKVYTTEVDEVLFKHPAVQMAAAFGVPDSAHPGSERVMAVVTLKNPGEQPASEDELRDFCRQHLAPYAVPRQIEIWDELPLTVSEKVFKKQLRDQFIARQAPGKG